VADQPHQAEASRTSERVSAFTIRPDQIFWCLLPLQRLYTTAVLSDALQGLLAALAGITTRQHFQINQGLLAEAALVPRGSPNVPWAPN